MLVTNSTHLVFFFYFHISITATPFLQWSIFHLPTLIYADPAYRDSEKRQVFEGLCFDMVLSSLYGAQPTTDCKLIGGSPLLQWLPSVSDQQQWGACAPLPGSR